MTHPTLHAPGPEAVPIPARVLTTPEGAPGVKYSVYRGLDVWFRALSLCVFDAHLLIPHQKKKKGRKERKKVKTKQGEKSLIRMEAKERRMKMEAKKVKRKK